MRRRGLVTLGYLALGALVARRYGYFGDFETIQSVLSVALAILLWPLLLLGIDLHVRL